MLNSKNGVYKTAWMLNLKNGVLTLFKTLKWYWKYKSRLKSDLLDDESAKKITNCCEMLNAI